MVSKSAPGPSSEWLTKSAEGSTPSYSIFTKDIQRSQQDDREYRLIRLENGLRALLVHDATADKAAASLDVAVGHLNDPDDMPGLAHFCEHLLFMGTEQFPRENEYSEFLSKNGGGSNAFTAGHNTNYYFSVGTKALPGALTRFSAFFHCPLFSPSCTSRELNAVDSEHKKNHQDDMWRIFQVNKHLSKAAHPWSKFGSGNRESLTAAGKALKSATPHVPVQNSASLSPSPVPSRLASPAPSVSSAASESDADGGAIGRETRRRLVDWWNKEYCASRMTLTILGKEPLDELATLTASLFSPILNRGQDPLPVIPDHPFGPNEMGTIVSVKTIMDFHCLELSFPIPYQPPHWRVKPAQFVSHFVGHEGPGSLHSYLKNKGWITGLSAGPQVLARGFQVFRVRAYLTKEGFQNYRSALLVVYKYLSLLRSSPLPEWYQDEIKQIQETRFRFQEKRRPDDYATYTSERLKAPCPPELVLSAATLIWDWDEQAVREILGMLTVDRGRAVIMAKAADHEHVMGGSVEWEKEPWYGTEYFVEKIDEQFIKLASGPNDIPALSLCGPNKFIPENLDVDKREVREPLKRPHIIRETPMSTLWHKKDDQFWIPKAHVMLDIRSPLANDKARNSVLTRLYADLVNDSLTEFAYDADLAGLSYLFGNHPAGVYMTMNGYNDKLPVLARNVLERMRNIQLKADRLEVMKEQAKLEYENFFMGQSYHLSDYYGRYILTEKQWTLSEKLNEISTVTVEELHVHISSLLSKVHMQVLVQGNLFREEAISIVSMAEEIIGASALSPLEVAERSLLLPEGCNYVWESQVSNPDEVNSALTYYCHVGDVVDPKLRTTFSLLSQILSEPTFDTLRTKEQLGYIVSSGQWHATASMGLRIVVQSEKGPEYLESRVEAFLESMGETLEKMKDEEFNEQKKGLQSKWTEKLKNLAEETNRFWTHIESGYLDFFRRERDADLLDSITKQDVLDIYHKFIHPASPTRSKLSVHLRPQKVAPPKMSVAASEAFLSRLRAHNIPVDEDQYSALSAAEPPVPAVKAHWADILLNGGKIPGTNIDPQTAQDLLNGIDAVVEKYPSPDAGVKVTLSAGVNYIEDVKAFRQMLEVSESAKPVQVFHDLPTSKF